MPEHDLHVVRNVTPRRFTVLADGSSRGDDAASADVAPAAQYAVRILAPVGELLGIGEFNSFEVSGSPSLEVTMTRDAAGSVTLRGGLGPETGPGPHPSGSQSPWQRPVGAADDLTFALGVLGDVAGVVGGVLMSADTRIVGSTAPRGVPQEALTTVGRRSVAALTSLHRHLRADDVQLVFQNGRVLVAPLSTGLALALQDPSCDTSSLRLAVQVAKAHLDQIDLGGLPAISDQPSPSPSAAATDDPKRPRRRLGVWA
jgi:hypothetical protein